MLELDTRRTLESIRRALVEARSQVRLTKTWTDLHEFYGVGSIQGRALLLTDTDRRTLRELVKQHCNIDLLAEGGTALQQLTTGDRLALGQQIANEKLSGNPVAADMVLIGSATGQLVLPDHTLRLPLGMLIHCHYSHLHGLQRLVLVENLAAMYALASYHWPANLLDTVMLFRGSPQDLPTAVTRAISGVEQVICFPDYDPQGLMNSLTQQHGTGVIIPTDEAVRALCGRGLSKSARYYNQAGAREWLAKQHPTYPPSKAILAGKIAISQEAMLGCELTLCLPS